MMMREIFKTVGLLEPFEFPDSPLGIFLSRRLSFETNGSLVSYKSFTNFFLLKLPQIW